MAKVNELGLTDAETNWITKRAAVHVGNGMLVRDAIGQALKDHLAFLTELAHGTTERSKAARTHMIRTIHSDINKGK